MTRAKQVVILEGPDGAGKTTLAERLVAELGARYVHLGPFPGLTDVARFYVDALQPALDGYQPVVLDRSWLSEPIYGAVHRGGLDRVGPVYARMLERVAWRCDPVVVRCLPPVEVCLQAFRARRGTELLDSEGALRQVHQLYATWNTSLNRVRSLGSLDLLQHDYTRNERRTDDLVRLLRREDLNHLSDQPAAAGNPLAPYVLVGEGFAHRKAADPLAQHPFVSFSGAGCSVWLTQQLLDAGIGEAKLLWANADLGREELQRLISQHRRRGVFALGTHAQQTLTGLAGVTAIRHPQHAKRFHHGQHYELINHLKTLENQL